MWGLLLLMAMTEAALIRTVPCIRTSDSGAVATMRMDKRMLCVNAQAACSHRILKKMPPKAAPVSSERVKKELLAQRARAEALKHLHATGSGPSQSELARQQAERQKLVNVTSAKVQRFVNGVPQQQTAADKYDPRVRDNTLHVVAVRRANEIHQTQTVAQQMNAFRQGRLHGDNSGTGADTALPDGWKEAKDPASGDTYYWNETGKASQTDAAKSEEPLPESVQFGLSTSGRSLLSCKQPILTRQSTVYAVVCSGWEPVTDPHSGGVYYWNRDSNETTWTRPVSTKVSLKEAMAAKSKLDDILKSCGPSAGSQSNKRPRDGNGNSNSSRPAQSHKKRYQQHGPRDPLDPENN
ncbi:hypothetical protein FI667_g6471, partial [Globisporangium splendens]